MRNAAGVPQGSMIYKRIKAAGEAGGFITQIDCHSDGTKLIAGDTLQPLWCNNAKPEWQQVLHASTRPAGFNTRSAANAASGKRDQNGSTGAAIAPSDSSIWYVCQEAIILRCTGYGASITMSPQTSYRSLANTTINSARIYGPYLQVHPTDPNRVMWGTGNGLVFSIDGFQTDKALTASVPAPTDDTFSTCVAFDPSNPARAYAHSWGNGLYVSTNANTANPTFSLVAGSPTKISRLRVSQTGKVYLCEAFATLAFNVWSYAGSTLTKLTGPNFSAHDVAIDPANANRLIAADLTGVSTQSTDGGATWSQVWFPDFGIFVVANDVPYTGNYRGGFDLGALCFDPSAANKLYAAQGLGVVWSNYPTPEGAIYWNTQSAGIYQLIPYSGHSPVGYKMLWSNQDRPIMRDNSGFDIPPSKYGPRANAAAGSPEINHCWHVTGSRLNPSYVVAFVHYDPNYIGAAADLSGWSGDGGQYFTRFPTPPTTAGGLVGGSMAVSQNPDQILCLPGDRQRMVRTLNRALSWEPVDLPGLPAGHHAGQVAYYMRRVPVATDTVTPGNFLIYHPGIPTNGSNDAANPANAGFFKFEGGLQNMPVRISTGYALANSAGSTFACRLEGIPGKAGCFVFAGDSDNQGLPLLLLTGMGATRTTIDSLTNCTSISFGAALYDGGNPALYAIGRANGADGIHYTTSDLTQPNPVWHTYGAVPLDEWASVVCIVADNNVPGRFSIGVDGKGWSYGQLTDTKLLV
jgi:hypothetical protein